ncbi:hypothetical protein L211DRAFT_766508, partial [Terfezia boudieri ATCC MYA-4762]
FRYFFCMNPDSFLYILSKIRDYIVFKNNSRYKQANPMLYLFIALRHLGSEASIKATVISFSQLFGIGYRTVILYTNWICIASQSLFNDIVKWPSVQEKDNMRFYIQKSRFGVFLGCIGILDRILIP